MERNSSPPVQVSGLTRASQLERGVTACEASPSLESGEWSFASRVPAVEIVGNAKLTAAVREVLAVQLAGGSAVWVSGREDIFFPPDLASNGVDLSLLPVVMVHRREECVEAVDTLMRSRFFQLIVVDWREGWPLEGALQARFVRLGRRHGVTLLFLCEADAGKGVSLMPVRLEARRERRGPGSYAVHLEVVRDKLGVRIPRREERARGPDGLR